VLGSPVGLRTSSRATPPSIARPLPVRLACPVTTSPLHQPQDRSRLGCRSSSGALDSKFQVELEKYRGERLFVPAPDVSEPPGSEKPDSVSASTQVRKRDLGMQSSALLEAPDFDRREDLYRQVVRWKGTFLSDLLSHVQNSSIISKSP
jgi:hypothetical protein